MPSTRNFLDHVLDLLCEVEGVTTRKMMGEYLLYANGTLFGGVYDDRFLIKQTPASRGALLNSALPYEGAKPMRLIDFEDRSAIAALVTAVCRELS